MNENEMKRFVKSFNIEFSAPFLDKGVAEAWMKKVKGKPYLFIKVGPRDIELDENMECIGAGTCLCCELKVVKNKVKAYSSDLPKKKR
jgi:hypothetical protein